MLTEDHWLTFVARERLLGVDDLRVSKLSKDGAVASAILEDARSSDDSIFYLEPSLGRRSCDGIISSLDP
ncbi:uncharacterized protein METZ01_LOCUS220824 [marine metagenome]|uniref:Uncharacterized protein n=1 Tax=marine metagenome TaxID=408172 RepID=A0A382FYA7_9ZZZZ